MVNATELIRRAHKKADNYTKEVVAGAVNLLKKRHSNQKGPANCKCQLCSITLSIKETAAELSILRGTNALRVYSKYEAIHIGDEIERLEHRIAMLNEKKINIRRNIL